LQPDGPIEESKGIVDPVVDLEERKELFEPDR
jgi:hypothetical protein